MFPVYNEMVLLGVLGENIHPSRPHGRGLAIALDHIANNEGFVDQYKEKMNSVMYSMINDGEPNYPDNLLDALRAARQGNEVFSSHLHKLWDKWIQKHGL